MALLARASRVVGSLQEEGPHPGNVEGEEDWGRVKNDGGGGHKIFEEALGMHLAQTVEPIVRVIARFRRRKIWSRQVHVPPTDVANPPIVVTSTDPSQTGSSLQPSVVTPTTTSSFSSSSSSTVAVLTRSLSLLSDTPSATPLPTITSTISNFTPNGTTVGR